MESSSARGPAWDRAVGSAMAQHIIREAVAGVAAQEHTGTTRSASSTDAGDAAGEVIGLDQSIGYARNLAVYAGEHGQAGNEGYIGHLTNAKVAGEALNTAHEMQAAFAAAAEAAEAHAIELEKQKAVQEAYDNNQDAGDKAFQTEGR